MSGTRTGLKISEEEANVQRKPLKDLENYYSPLLWKQNVKLKKKLKTFAQNCMKIMKLEKGISQTADVLICSDMLNECK